MQIAMREPTLEEFAFGVFEWTSPDLGILRLPMPEDEARDFRDDWSGGLFRSGNKERLDLEVAFTVKNARTDERAYPDHVVIVDVIGKRLFFDDQVVYDSLSE